MKRRLRHSFSSLALAFVVAGACEAHAATNARTTALATAPDNSVRELERAFARAAKRIEPSVVLIRSTRQIRRGSSFPSFGGLGGRDAFEAQGLGSGVIVDRRGYVLTNNHVVAGADELEVELSDQRTVSAEVVGTDPYTDLAVIRMSAKGLQPAQLGRSADLHVGQWVLAVGSPFGLQQSVTAGIISAVGRGGLRLAQYGNFIQTDAAINQGNSGGPLVDLDGRVIGINAAIASASRVAGSNGVGFTIPIDLARRVMDQLIRNGKVVRAWLGVVMGELSPALARSFGYQGKGILIDDMDPDGPATKAGLKPGDILLRMDGAAVTSPEQFRNTIANSKPGSMVRFAVWRQGKTREVRVKLATLPGVARQGSAPPKRKVDRGSLAPGLSLVEATPSVRRRFEIRGPARVVIGSVERNSAAADAGLRPGDVLEQVGANTVQSVDQARRLLRAANLGLGVRLRVRRGPYGHFVVLRRNSD